MPLLIDLFFFTMVISLYDLKTRRIPNWATIPMVIAGLIVHFPGTVTLLVATAFIVALGFLKLPRAEAQGFLEEHAQG